MAMFGGRPVILVKQAPQLTPALFEELLSAPLAAFIVIEAGNLKKDAKLRQLFEKAKNAAAIVCYGADSRSLQQLIREDVQKAGLTIAADAAQRLGQLLGGNWATSTARPISRRTSPTSSPGAISGFPTRAWSMASPWLPCKAPMAPS